MRHRNRDDDEVMIGGTARAVLEAISDALVQSNSDASAKVQSGLTALTGREWVRLDEAARPWTVESPLAPMTDWRFRRFGRIDMLTAVAGSMHRDGRIRQQAVRALGLIPGPVTAAALALRTNDWVPQVQSDAWRSLAARSGAPDTAVIVSVLLVLTARQRGQAKIARYLSDLAGGSPETVLSLAAIGDQPTQLWALNVLHTRGVLDDEALAARALDDPSPVIALWCARRLLITGQGLPAHVGARLLSSTRAGVRAFAVQHTDAGHLTRETLSGLLLDRSAAVRSLARWRWVSQWGDAAVVYRDALLAPSTSSRGRAAALQALDELAATDALDYASRSTTHPSPRVRCVAAGIIGRRGTGDDISRLLSGLLSDDSGKVAAAAVRYLRRSGAVPAEGLLFGLDHADTARSRRHALALRQSQGNWERVHADLTAINGTDTDLADRARTDLLAWLQHGAATTYGQPTPDQTGQFIALLPGCGLSEPQRQAIAFVAGIRTRPASHP